MGGPRQILRGQKVHVSALFRTNYTADARFHRGFDTWPALMSWNDPRNHDRLQNLSSTWEMDIFDSRSVQSLLATLQLRRTNLDALDRLAFMATFGKFTLLHTRHRSDRPMKTAAEALSRVLRTLNRRWRHYYRMEITLCALVLP